jgi:hypothetical protein
MSGDIDFANQFLDLIVKLRIRILDQAKASITAWPCNRTIDMHYKDQIVETRYRRPKQECICLSRAPLLLAASREKTNLPLDL